MISVKSYTWDDLTWRETKRGVFKSAISLYPAEYIRIEHDWIIYGPVRVSFTWKPKSNSTSVEYEPLGKDEFNLDDPTEYPCRACGADRKMPCEGENIGCTFRVFLIDGGEL